MGRTRHAPAHVTLRDRGKVKKATDAIADGGLENRGMPADITEARPELETVEDALANPELVGGRLHNCPDGWGCRIANDNLVVACGVEEAGIEVFNHGSGETLAASMASAYENEEPWFGGHWGSTAPLGNCEMVPIDMGPYRKPAHACVHNADCENPRKTSLPAAPVLTGVTTDFATREPGIAKLVSNIQVFNRELSNLLAWQTENMATPRTRRSTS